MADQHDYTLTKHDSPFSRSCVSGPLQEATPSTGFVASQQHKGPPGVSQSGGRCQKSNRYMREIPMQLRAVVDR